MGAQNFNFALKLSQNEGFQPQVYHFWFFKNLLTRRKIFDNFPTAQNLRGSHDVTEVMRLTVKRNGAYHLVCNSIAQL